MFSRNDLQSNISSLVFTCFALMLAWLYVRSRLHWWVTFSKLPGPSYIQQFMNLWQFIFKSELIDLAAAYQAFTAPLAQKYPLMALGAGSKSLVLLCNAESAKALLSSKTQLEKALIYKQITPIFGDGVGTCKVTKWHQRRRLLNPSFHIKMLENYVVVMNKQADTMVHLLEDKSNRANDTTFNICPYISRCTLDIICETAMSKSRNTQTTTDNGYCKAVETLIQMMTCKFLNPWLWFDMIAQFTPESRIAWRAIETANSFPNKVIENRFRTFASDTKRHSTDDLMGKKRPMVMLDILMEASVVGSGSQTLTEEDISDEVRTFMIGGFETSFVSISWVLYHIGRDPAVQQKIVCELNNVFGDCDRHSCVDDLNNLQYLECVIKETMRLHPPIPIFGRHLTEEMTICGSTIPADTDVFIWTYQVHRDPTHYPDPESFYPDRFLPEKSQGRHPFAFIPFSAGPRNCIGQKYAMMEVKVVITSILRRFRVTALEQDQISNVIGGFITNPLQGIWVKFDSKT